MQQPAPTFSAGCVNMRSDMLSLNCLSLLVKAFMAPLLTGTRLDGAAELFRVVAPFYQKRPIAINNVVQRPAFLV